MLSCEDVTDKLSAQIDGELSLREQLRLRLHQFICSDCRNAARNMRALALGLKDRLPSEEECEACSMDVNDDYIDRVMEAIRREEQKDSGDLEQ